MAQKEVISLRKALVGLVLCGLVCSLAISVLAGCSGKRDPEDAPPIAAVGVDEGKLPEPGSTTPDAE